jgi:Ca2+-binding RTX toxin-like protein
MAIKIKAGDMSGDAGFNWDTFFASYYEDVEADGTIEFYNGTSFPMLTGNQMAQGYTSDKTVVIDGADFVYNYNFQTGEGNHALSGTINQLTFGTHGEDGLRDLTGTGVTISGLNITNALGEFGPTNNTVSGLMAGDPSYLEGLLDDEAQIFVGTAFADTYTGTAFDDKIVGTAGADSLDGGDGVDVVTYSNFETAVSVNLGAGTGPDGSVLTNIENVVGTGLGDILLGSAVDNMIKGGHGIDRVYGLEGNDSIIGGSGGDIIHAGAGADTVVGGGDADDITGRAGADLMSGGKGENIYRYLNPVEGVFDSGIAKEDRDLITDFKVGKDLLDFSGMDADPAVESDQAFVFIGTEAFTGEAGELRYSSSKSVTTVAGDVDGDGKADFKIDLTGKLVLTDLDFVL